MEASGGEATSLRQSASAPAQSFSDEPMHTGLLPPEKQKWPAPSRHCEAILSERFAGWAVLL